jgi:hypothetical protein
MKARDVRRNPYTETKYKTDDLREMLREVAGSQIFNNAMDANLEKNVKMTITEFLAVVASEMKIAEADYKP